MPIRKSSAARASAAAAKRATLGVTWAVQQRRMDSILDAIGRTPLVRLVRVAKGYKPSIFVKLEAFSPTGSLKDRIYLNMFRRAIEAKTLRRDMEILECSTGNAGIACAWVSAVMGYACTIIMPEGMSEERKKMIRAYGATIIFTPGAESNLDLSLQKLEEIRARSPKKYFVPGQFDNPANPEAHYLAAGPEIWEQMNGEVDIFVATQGTGGTVSGIGKYLKERNPEVKIFAAEPAECPLLTKRQWGAHKIEGVSGGFVPRNLDLSIIDGVVTVASNEAIEMARRLPREEGIFCGVSAAANVIAAQKLARKFPKAANIVTVIGDSGDRYFTTEVFGAPKSAVIPEREHPLDEYTLEQLDQYQPEWTFVD